MGASYEYAYSYTKWDKRADTWHRVTKLLILRGIPECGWLIPEDDPNNVAIWEAYGTPLENPCWWQEAYPRKHLNRLEERRDQ